MALNATNKQCFKFKQFEILQSQSTMKVNTDGILLGAWAPLAHEGLILDIGTGTGVIALMLAQRNPNCLVYGVEIEEKSGTEAFLNAKNSPFIDRVQIHIQSIQEFADSSTLNFDLIVTNPPFFSGGTHSSNENKLNVRHSVKMPHSDLIKAVNKLLKRDGIFSLILPYVEGLRFVELAHLAGIYLYKTTEVYSKPAKVPERLLMSFTKIPMVSTTDRLHIRGSDGGYTEEYIELTKEFYLGLTINQA